MATKGLMKMTDVKIRVILFIVILAAFASINPSVVSLTNMLGMVNNSIFNGIAALGMLVVMVTGNFDLSSMSVAMFATFLTLKFYAAIGYQGDFVTMFVIAGIIGAAAAMVTGWITQKFKLSGFVVSIGMNLLLANILFVFLNSSYIKEDSMPAKVLAIRQTNVITVVTEGGTKASLNMGILVLAAVALGVWLLLNKTQLGRGIYALGGDKVALERVGYKPVVIYLLAYAVFGFCCGVAGIYYYGNAGMFEPAMISAKGSNVIASAIFGGCNMKDGKGTVAGILIGVAIITLVNDNLILLGVPSFGIMLVVGLLILTSVLLSSFSERRIKKD